MKSAIRRGSPPRVNWAQSGRTPFHTGNVIPSNPALVGSGNHCPSATQAERPLYVVAAQHFLSSRTAKEADYIVYRPYDLVFKALGQTCFTGKTVTMGSCGELGSFLQWRLNGQSFMHGLVQVKRQFSKICALVFRDGERLLNRRVWESEISQE